MKRQKEQPKEDQLEKGSDHASTDDSYFVRVNEEGIGDLILDSDTVKNVKNTQKGSALFNASDADKEK